MELGKCFDCGCEAGMWLDDLGWKVICNNPKCQTESPMYEKPDDAASWWNAREIPQGGDR